MITTLVFYPLPQVAPNWAAVYLFVRDGLVGALVVCTAASLCGIV